MLPKICAWVTVLILFTGSVANAQEFIGVFSDTRGCPCDITDRGGGAVLNITVLHVNSPGARASQFAVPKPQCFFSTYLFDTPAFSVWVGNSQTGISIGYEGCRTGTFQILTVTYFVQGLTGDCCYYPVLPDPNEPNGKIAIADCDYQLKFPPGWYDIINSTGNCLCYVGPEYCYPVAVEDITWGKIKALYQTP